MVITLLCSQCPWPSRGSRVYFFLSWRPPFYLFSFAFINYLFGPGANSRHVSWGRASAFLFFVCEPRSDKDCGAKATLVAGFSALGCAPKSNADKVQAVLSWMKAIRFTTTVSAGDDNVLGTRAALQRFIAHLIKERENGADEFATGCLPLIPHLVRRENLAQWLRAESVEPARTEN